MFDHDQLEQGNLVTFVLEMPLETEKSVTRYFDKAYIPSLLAIFLYDWSFRVLSSWGSEAT